MSIKTKFSLAALCVAVLASASASALTNVGTGNITINGTIGTTTCTVAPSLTTITFPQLSPTTIAGSALATELARQSFQMDFKDCNAAGNVMTVKFARDVAPPNGVGGGLFKGGFTYTGGVSTDSTKGPLAYKLIQKFNGASVQPKLDNTADSSHDVDISGATNKSSFAIPYDIVIEKAPASGVHPSTYAGNYSANMTYEISYP